MKKIFTYAFVGAALFMSVPAANANVEPSDPLAGKTKIVEMVFSRAAIDCNYSFQISANDGQSVVVDWGDGTISAPVKLANYDDAGWVFTTVEGKIAGAKVTVYGADPVTINYFDASYSVANGEDTKMISVDVSLLKGCTEITLDTNSLTSLDVSNCAALVTLSAIQNEITELTLPASEVLKNVYMGNQISTATGEVTLGKNSVLGTDWSVAPNITSLKLSGNSAEDLSWWSPFDISALTKLTTLELNCCGLEDLDIQDNVMLKTFNAQWNKFEAIDLSHMVAKGATVFLAHNNITGGEFVPTWGEPYPSFVMPDTSTDKMTRLNIEYNAFTFLTLPAPGMTANANNYAYANQAPVSAGFNSENAIDLSAYAKIGENETVFTATAEDAEGNTLTLDDTNFSIANGVVKFVPNVKNAVVTMTNATFPKLTLTTTPAMSLGLIPDAFSFTVDAAQNVLDMNIFASEPTDVYVDFGDGKFTGPFTTEYDIWTEGYYAELKGTCVGTAVNVKADPTKLTGIDYSVSKYDENPAKVVTINISNLSELQTLNLNNNLLEDVDFTSNTKIESISLQSNKIKAFNKQIASLVSLNLGNANAGAIKEYGENELSEINLANFPALKELNCSFTGLQFDFTKATNLSTIDMDGNGLKSIDLSKCAGLTDYLRVRWNEIETLDLSGLTTTPWIYAINNNISEVKLPAQKLANMYISNNKLTFANMPALDAFSSINYAPQQDMEVATEKGIVDLSSQAMVGATATTFEWTAAGEAIAESDFTVAGGVFTFEKAQSQAVCSMKNAEYPALTLKTVAMDIAASTSAIDGIDAEAAEVEYFNLQGVRVSGNEPGIYVRRQGNKISKVVVK